MKHEFTWNGHSNFMVRSETASLVIDPFFDGNPSAKSSWDSIDKLDLILLTHDHDDHTGQTVEIAKKTGAKVVTIFDVAGKLAEMGVPQDQLVGMNIGGTVEQCGLKIKMVQATHSAKTGAPTGFIVTCPDGFCFYHAGDTGLFATMELFGKFHDIDLALLPIGGWFTMDAHDAAYACKLLQTIMVAPMHWGTFPILEQNTDSFEKYLGELAPGVKLVAFEPGETRVIDKVSDDECVCDD